MQGEKIGEESGKVTSRRVLPNPGGSPKMETSVRTDLTLLGVKASNTVINCGNGSRRELRYGAPRVLQDQGVAFRLRGVGSRAVNRWAVFQHLDNLLP